MWRLTDHISFHEEVDYMEFSFMPNVSFAEISMIFYVVLGDWKVERSQKLRLTDSLDCHVSYLGSIAFVSFFLS